LRNGNIFNTLELLLDDIDEERNGYGFDIISIDSLQTIVAVLGDNLPYKFSGIVSNMETYVTQGHEFEGDFYKCVERLIALLSINKKLDKLEPTLDDDDDLAYFQITQAEKTAITMLAADMRKIVSTSNQFDMPHKVRLLKRISAIEQEIHKEKGLFDVILGGISDIGETAGQFGEDVKPLVERMAEIEQITRGKSPDYAQLEKPTEVLKIEDQTDEIGDV